MDTNKTVFVTGATGFIGQRVARAFRQAGWRVLGLTRDAAKGKRLAAEEIVPVIGTLQDPSTWRASAASADVLVHAAVDYTTDTQALDQAVVTELVELAGARRATVIYTSGVWVHGDTAGSVVDETAPLAPAAVVSRRPDTERLVLQASKVRGIVVRPAVVYGHGGGLTASWFADQPVVGDGNNHWPMVHVDDLADAYLRAAERGNAGSVYLVADDSRPRVAELVSAARKAAGLQASTKWLPASEARKTMGVFADALVLDQQVSAARAQRELGWRARHAGFIEEAALYAAAVRANGTHV